MIEGWRSVPLEDVAEDITVGFVGPMASEYVPVGIPFLRSQNVEPLRINFEDTKYITPAFHERLRKSALRPDDVVIVRTGKPGACAVVPSSLPVANCSDVVIVRCGPRLDPRFLAYYVNTSATHHVASNLVGAVQQHFNVGAARRLQLLLPDLPEQRAIARILGSLDDKIDLNRRMNETLEAMARAIFKSWFVDFDPVRAKMERRRPVGMNAETAALFPDRMQESEIGEIPAGWKSGPFMDVAKLLSGGTPKTDRDEYWNGGVPWASAKDVSQAGEPFLVRTERTITIKGLEESATKMIPSLATVVVARGATTGRMVMFGCDMAMNQTCYALVSTLGTPFALYCQLRFEMDGLVQSAHGSVFDTITTTTFAASKVVQADSRPLACFEGIARPLFSRVLSNVSEMHSLAALRDTLLPKLLSGELRIPDAEKFVEAAT